MSAPRCPRCGSSWNPRRERALCGAAEDGNGCVPVMEATMRWCKRQGIEPVMSERRSLQAWKRRFRIATATITFALLLPVTGWAAIYACFSCQKCYDVGAENAGAALLACQTVAKDNGMARYGVAWIAGSQDGVPCAQLALVPGAAVASYQSTFRLGPARQVFCIEGAPAASLVTVAAPSVGLAQITGLRETKVKK